MEEDLQEEVASQLREVKHKKNRTALDALALQEKQKLVWRGR